MKKITGALFLFTLLIALTGCPLSKDFPIDEPSVKVNPAWYGTYTDELGKTNYDGKPSTISIGPATDYEYDLKELHYTEDSLGNTVINLKEYRLFVSVVKGKNFINVGSKDESSYYFYKIDTDGKNLVASEVASSTFVGGWSDKITNSKELKNFFGKHVKNELLYGDVITLKRN